MQFSNIVHINNYVLSLDQILIITVQENSIEAAYM